MLDRLHARLAASFIGLLAVVFLALGAYLAVYVERLQFDALRARLESQARLVADAAAPAVRGPDPAAADALAHRLGAAIGARVTIVAADGTVLGDSEADPRAMENHAGRPEIAAALAGRPGEQERRSATLHRGLLYVAVPIRDQGRVIGAARVALPSGDVSQARHRVVAIIAGTLLVAALASGALSLLLSKIVTRPLADLAAVARRISGGDLTARVSSEARGEVGDLALAFDEMTRALQETIHTIERDRLQLSAIVEHLADGVLIVDERDELLLANQAAERLLGIPRGASPGRSYVEAARDVDLVDLVQAARAPGGGEAAAQGRFVELGPPRRVVQAFAYPIPDGGAPLVVVILRDVTEFRRTEEIRRDFVANVSHELRTPIASLKALVETLLDGALEDEVAAREFLGRMEVEVDDLARLVQELLDLSRAESGRLALQTAATDVGAVVERAVARLRAQAEQRGIDLRVALPPTLPAAEVDPERVEQVLVNLLHNAVKFTPSGGLVTASAEAGAGEIVVRVADTGPGVPAGEEERIFERFYKVDRSRADAGSGLGLAIAKHLVQLHRGRIWVEPSPAGGATFAFTLPLAPSPAPAGARAARPIDPAPGSPAGPA